MLVVLCASSLRPKQYVEYACLPRLLIQVTNVELVDCDCHFLRRLLRIRWYQLLSPRTFFGRGCDCCCYRLYIVLLLQY